MRNQRKSKAKREKRKKRWLQISTAGAPQATAGKVSGLILIMKQLLELQRWKIKPAQKKWLIY